MRGYQLLFEVLIIAIPGALNEIIGVLTLSADENGETLPTYSQMVDLEMESSVEWVAKHRHGTWDTAFKAARSCFSDLLLMTNGADDSYYFIWLADLSVSYLTLLTRKKVKIDNKDETSTILSYIFVISQTFCSGPTKASTHSLREIKIYFPH